MLNLTKEVVLLKHCMLILISFVLTKYRAGFTVNIPKIHSMYQITEFLRLQYLLLSIGRAHSHLEELLVMKIFVAKNGSIVGYDNQCKFYFQFLFFFLSYNIWKHCWSLVGFFFFLQFDSLCYSRIFILLKDFIVRQSSHSNPSMI